MLDELDLTATLSDRNHCSFCSDLNKAFNFFPFTLKTDSLSEIIDGMQSLISSKIHE